MGNAMSMIVIDGSQGEGGGQVLRTSLALSLVTGKPFRIENIRAKREKPGLLRQHLTAVNAATKVSDAAVEGAQLGATTLTFVPRAVRSGDYRFAIGTAGSTTLVLQTILLPLAIAAEPSTLAIEGGTHNPHALPFEFLENAFIPLLRRMGAGVELELVRPGFYPAGGGEIRVRITPLRRLGPLHIEERGEIVSRRVRAVVAISPTPSLSGKRMPRPRSWDGAKSAGRRTRSPARQAPAMLSQSRLPRRTSQTSSPRSVH